MKCLWLLVLSNIFQVYSHDKWIRVHVPQYVIPGEAAQLLCEYDLGVDNLYSVKWYKEQEEFYRYVPTSHPKASSYKVDGVYVDMSKSNDKTVSLYPVDWKSSGLYKCEVSAEAPSFDSCESESTMEVVFLPDEDPIIVGESEQYDIGDEINFNCTSGRSRPASTLQWYINEQRIQKPEALIEYPIKHHDKGLVTSTLGLKFVLKHRHFLGGSMRLKCVASVEPLVSREDRELAQTVYNFPSAKDFRETQLLVRSSSSTGNKYLASYVLLINLTLAILS